MICNMDNRQQAAFLVNRDRITICNNSQYNSSHQIILTKILKHMMVNNGKEDSEYPAIVRKSHIITALWT